MSYLCTDKKHVPGPLVIGAMGGSGTRVVGEIIQEIGFYLGGDSDLNHALDNVWFTFLFKRPKWYGRIANEEPSVFLDYIEMFEKRITGKKMTLGDYFSILKVAVGISFLGPKSSKGKWLAHRILALMSFQKFNISSYIGWGWKEPNSHIYLDYLSQYFPDLKYIHVVRHGLDMAYSNNQQQLYNWGETIGIELPDTPRLLPQASLRFWIKANQRAVKLGEKLLAERFYVLNFDNLCVCPRREICSLIDFLGIKVNSEKIDQLVQLPKLPKTSGRYKKHDLSIFNEGELEDVREFGFVID